MARQDRLQGDLERGWAALDDGDLELAAQCVERCQRIDRAHADVIALDAAIAEASGDAERALARYHELMAALPDEAGPRIAIARLQLAELGDADAALASLDPAFELIDDDQLLIEAIIVRCDALLALGDDAGARETLAELASTPLDDARLALELAELAHAAGDPALARQWIELARADAEVETDALHLLGSVRAAADDLRGAAEVWQTVRARDAAEPPGELAISEDALEQIASDALAELPPEVRGHLARVPILIDDAPNEAMVADGVDPRLLGLFQGTPLSDAGDLAPSVTQIWLFRRNLERIAHDLDHLAEEVRITVLHETAHYFGLDEDDLVNLGLD